jgi:hypothetical protein
MCGRVHEFERWKTHVVSGDHLWPCRQEYFEIKMRADYNRLMKWDDEKERKWLDRQAKVSFDEENIFEDFQIDDFIE